MTAIIVDRLTRRVPDAGREIAILDDVSFTVQVGQSVAITGASGSGKSTLLGLVAGLDLPTSGEVTLLGQRLFALDEDGRARWRATHVGFVFQSFQLLPHLTALENAMLPCELQGDAEGARHARELLERVGLGERLHHYPRTLSGGEQQRVALARAFAMRPPLLLADEPTGSLDANTGERVIEMLFELNRESRSTLLLVTHDDSLAARCERRIVLRAGRMVEDAPTGARPAAGTVSAA